MISATKGPMSNNKGQFILLKTYPKPKSIKTYTSQYRKGTVYCVTRRKAFGKQSEWGSIDLVISKFTIK